MPPQSLVSSSDALRGLVPAVIAGDVDAIERFVRAMAPMVLRVVRQVLGVHHPEVPDVVQEATFAILEALGRFRDEASVSHFAWRVAALTAMNTRRKCRLREQYAAELPDLDNVSQGRDSPFGLFVAAKRREAFRHLLEELPAAQADALTMHCVLGFTLEEAALASGVPTNTVRSRLIAAKSSLRKKLSTDPDLLELLSGVS